MNPRLDPAVRRQRWERIGLGIRLAYNPARTDVLRLWLMLGQRLAAEQVLDEAWALRRSLSLLLHTADDIALPWAWRNACLEHCTWPLARLLTLLRLHDPPAAEAWHAAVQSARDRLAALPPAARAPQL